MLAKRHHGVDSTARWKGGASLEDKLTKAKINRTESKEANYETPSKATFETPSTMPPRTPKHKGTKFPGKLKVDTSIPRPLLKDCVPKGENPHTLNSYLDDAQDVVNIAERLAEVEVFPVNYPAKGPANTNGQLDSYMRNTMAGLLAFALSFAGCGTKKHADWKEVGKIGALKDHPNPVFRKIWRKFLKRLTKYIFEWVIPKSSDIKLGLVEDKSAYQAWKYAVGKDLCKASIWSKDWLITVVGLTKVDNSVCQGHCYELALLWDILLPGFHAKVTTPADREKRVTPAEAASYFSGNAAKRLYDHELPSTNDKILDHETTQLVRSVT